MDKYNLEEIREQLNQNTLYGDAMDVAKFLLGLLDEAQEEINSLEKFANIVITHYESLRADVLQWTQKTLNG